MKFNSLIKLSIYPCLAICLLIPPAFSATYTPGIFTDRDSGACNGTDCSLREAIKAANSTTEEDTIQLLTGTYVLTLDGPRENASATGDLDITADLTIKGENENDAGATIISGITGSLSSPTSQLDDRIFHISGLSGPNVTLQNLTVSNGQVDAENGGAIFNSSSTTLILDNVIVRESGTTNLDGSPHQGLGGGIYNEGTLIIRNGSLITGNTANVDQEDQRASYGGGGLHNSATGKATITDTTFRRNIALNSFTPAAPSADFSSFASGGGILNLGTLHIETSLVGAETETIIEPYKTSAESAANISDAGGGITNIGGFLTINKTTISYNKTTTSAPTDQLEGRVGGGLFGQNAGENRGSLLITASTISHNVSDKIGGGIFNSGSPITITHSTISNNKAGFLGGGISNVGNQAAEISNSTIAYNTIDNTISAATRGGGLYTSSRINVTSVTIAGNDADDGAQLYIQDNSTTDNRNVKPQITLTNTLIDHHQTLITDSLEAPTAEINCGGGTDFIVSKSYNLDSGNTCNLDTAFSDIIDTDPQLATSLATNPGDLGTIPSTKTIAFASNTSAAIDIRAGTGCPSRDQRYFRRTPRCDAGAYEEGATEGAATQADIKVTISEGRDPALTDTQLTYVVSVTNIGPHSLTNSDIVTMDFSLPTTLAIDDSSVATQMLEGASGSCGAGTNGNIICSLSALSAFETRRMSITLIPKAAGTLSVTATVSSNNVGADYFPANNTFTETTEIQNKNNCDISISGCDPFPNSSGGGGLLQTSSLLVLLSWFSLLAFMRRK